MDGTTKLQSQTIGAFGPNWHTLAQVSDTKPTPPPSSVTFADIAGDTRVAGNAAPPAADLLIGKAAITGGNPLLLASGSMTPTLDPAAARSALFG